MSLYDRVAAEAKELSPGRTLATLAILPFAALGFVAGLATRALWVVIAWSWTAILVGYRLVGVRKADVKRLRSSR